MGKLLHTYNPISTSMTTDPLSWWNYAFCVSIKYSFGHDTHLNDWTRIAWSAYQTTARL